MGAASGAASGSETRWAIALSGGPDSLALLLLARSAMPGCVIAATVDHGLRSESADEAQFCADLCTKLGVPHTVLTVNVGPGNVQANARAARYAALDHWCQGAGAAALMTAHHADDQAETLLMRLNRGSGLSGLAGVRRDTVIPSGSGRLLRPLLTWRKAELEAIVAGAGITPIRDPSNSDDRFDRARIRKAVAKAEWLDPVQMAVSAAHLQEAEAFAEIVTQEVWDAHVEASPGSICIQYGAIKHSLIEGRIVLHAMAQLTGAKGRANMSDAARLIALLKEAKGGNVAGVWGVVQGSSWLLRPEPPRKQP